MPPRKRRTLPSPPLWKPDGRFASSGLIWASNRVLPSCATETSSGDVWVADRSGNLILPSTIETYAVDVCDTQELAEKLKCKLIWGERKYTIEDASFSTFKTCPPTEAARCRFLQRLIATKGWRAGPAKTGNMVTDMNIPPVSLY